MSERLRGILFVLAAALAWSAGGLGVKLVDAQPLAIAGLRSVFAAVVLAIVFARAARPLSPVAAARDLVRRPLLWGAATGYAVMLVCFVSAAKLTTAANAILIQYTGPIYVALLSWPLLREPVRAMDWVAVGACALGMAVFFGGHVALAPEARMGDLLAIVSSFGFAALPLQIRMEQRRAEADPARTRLVPALPVAACLLGNLLAAVACAPWAVTGAPTTARGWAILVPLGVVQIGVAYALYSAGVRRLRAVESSLVSTLEPILAPVWVFLGTGERPSHAALLGGALIVGGVTAQGLARAPQPPAAPVPARHGDGA